MPSYYILGITPAQLARLEKQSENLINKLETAANATELGKTYAEAKSTIAVLSDEPQLQSKYESLLEATFNKIVSKEAAQKLAISDADLKKALGLGDEPTPEQITQALNTANENIEKIKQELDNKKKQYTTLVKQLETEKDTLESEIATHTKILEGLAQGKQNEQIVLAVQQILAILGQTYNNNKVGTANEVFGGKKNAAEQLQAYLLDLSKARDDYARAWIGGDWNAIVNRIPNEIIP
jgi:chromosome segregation ATPase